MLAQAPRLRSMSRSGLAGKARGASITGENMLALIGALRMEGNHLTTSANAGHHNRELGRALTDAAAAFRTNMAPYSQADAVQLFAQADETFANLGSASRKRRMSDEEILRRNS